MNRLFKININLVGICAFCVSFTCSIQYQTEIPTDESISPELLATILWTQHNCCLNIRNPLNLRNVHFKTQCKLIQSISAQFPMT